MSLLSIFHKEKAPEPLTDDQVQRAMRESAGTEPVFDLTKVERAGETALVGAQAESNEPVSTVEIPAVVSEDDQSPEAVIAAEGQANEATEPNNPDQQIPA